MLFLLRGGLWSVVNAREEVARVAPSALSLVLPFTVIGGSALPAFVDAGSLMLRVRWSSAVVPRVQSRQGAPASTHASVAAQAWRGLWSLVLPFSPLGSSSAAAGTSLAAVASAAPSGLYAIALPYSVLGGGARVVATPAESRVEALVQASSPFVARVRSRSFGTTF